jgi:hypothetical protein
LEKGHRLRQVLSRPFCVNEIRMALQYRKNVVLVFQTSKDFGGVPGTFSEFYGPELKKAFPHPNDYSWLTRNNYVQFYDRGRHVKVSVTCRSSSNVITRARPHGRARARACAWAGARR